MENRRIMNKLEPYQTELRRELIARRRDLTRMHLLKFEKTKQSSQEGQSKVVTIDTNKARSNSDVLRLAIRDLGWREFPFQRRDHNCDITWHAISFYDQSEIYSGQVNKFPGSAEIFRKVNTFRWLEFMKGLFPDDYSFFPRTWLLPYHYNDFAYSARSANEKKSTNKPMYIVKPSEGSQGQGIYLLEDPLSYINYNNRSHVVQEYLSNVLLIDKYKFDLRVYVVVRSIDPLEVHICKEGLARFSTVPYEQPTSRNMHETFMHLTNYSLNKKSSDFKISEKDDEGSKRKMSAVFKKMSKLGYDVEAVWTQIETLVLKTLIAVAGEMKVEYQAAIPPGKPGPTCFQVLGFDIILMDNLQPMLLEVNSNPSLSITEEHETPEGCVEYTTSTKDEEVKRTLIRDTLMLVAPKHKYTRSRRRQQQLRNINNNKSNNNSETDINIANQENNRSHRRNPQRESDISITHVEDEIESIEKSMFYQPDDYASKRKIARQASGVFFEEEESVYTEEEQTSALDINDYIHPQIGTISSLRSWIAKRIGRSKKVDDKIEVSNRLPAVVVKNEERSEDVVLETFKNPLDVSNRLPAVVVKNEERSEDVVLDKIDVSNRLPAVVVKNEERSEDVVLDKVDVFNRLPAVVVKNEESTEDVVMEEKDEDSQISLSSSSESREQDAPEDENDDDDDEDDVVNDDDDEEQDEDVKDGKKEEEEKSCLKEIFPGLHGESFRNGRIIEKLADMFILFLGVKGNLHLSPSMFRLFARKCHLGKKGLTNVDIDIMYIDLHRKWEYMNPDRTSGLNFFAFVSGCCKLASDTFPGTPKAQINSFIQHCHKFMKIPTDLDLEAEKRIIRYGHVFSRDKRKEYWKLPSTDQKHRPGGLDIKFIDESSNSVHFPHLHQRNINIFHTLQNIKK